MRLADVVAAGEEARPGPDPHHPVEHLRVVGHDLRLAGPLVQPRLRPARLQPPPPSSGRGDAVEARGLVQPDEGVGLQPVPADAVATVDQRDARVGVVDQRVGERHPDGAGADHEVVGLEGASHGSTLDLGRGVRCAREP